MAKKQAPRATPTKATVDRFETLRETAEAASKVRATKAKKALAEIRKLMIDTAKSAWQLGRALKAFQSDRLYVALGYESFDAFLEGERLLARNQAFKLMRVVGHFSEAQVAQLGVEKAAALIGYADATPAKDTAAGLLMSDALVGQKRVLKASVADIAQAAGAVRASVSSGASASRSSRANSGGRAPSAEEKRRVATIAKREKRLLAKLEAAGLPKGVVATRGDRVTVTFDAAALDET